MVTSSKILLPGDRPAGCGSSPQNCWGEECIYNRSGTTVVSNTPTHPDPGLCRDCQCARRIESDRGSIFLMCKLSFEDSRFTKYPRLPVLVCSGYRPESADPEDADPEDNDA